MSEREGPWGRAGGDPPPKLQPRVSGGRRPWLWLALLAGLAAIVFGLNHAFPEALRGKGAPEELAYRVALLAVLAAGLARVGRAGIAQHLKHAAIWAGVLAVGVLGFAYRDVFEDLPRRVQLVFSDGQPVATGERELTIPQDETGSFTVVGQVNGQRIRFTVDTGATETVLAPEDARRLGLDVGSLDYRFESETANGKGLSAAFTADRIEVGAIRFDDFTVAVNQAPMSTSLLGMSFLRRLDAFEFRGRNLILKYH